MRVAVLLMQAACIEEASSKSVNTSVAQMGTKAIGVNNFSVARVPTIRIGRLIGVHVRQPPPRPREGRRCHKRSLSVRTFSQLISSRALPIPMVTGAPAFSRSHDLLLADWETRGACGEVWFTLKPSGQASNHIGCMRKTRRLVEKIDDVAGRSRYLLAKGRVRKLTMRMRHHQTIQPLSTLVLLADLNVPHLHDIILYLRRGIRSGMRRCLSRCPASPSAVEATLPLLTLYCDTSRHRRYILVALLLGQ
jgi:hypothetical protein